MVSFCNPFIYPPSSLTISGVDPACFFYNRSWNLEKGFIVEVHYIPRRHSAITFHPWTTFPRIFFFQNDGFCCGDSNHKWDSCCLFQWIPELWTQFALVHVFRGLVGIDCVHAYVAGTPVSWDCSSDIDKYVSNTHKEPKINMEAKDDITK